MKKTYEPPIMEVWMIDLQRSADLLVSLSLQGMSQTLSLVMMMT